MTSVDIVNLTLAIMGVSPILAFTDDTPIASECNILYKPAVKYCLSIHNWNFSLKQVSLAKLTTNTNNTYAFAYQEPDNVLKITKVRDGNNDPIDYVESGSVIYTNSDTAILTYVQYYNGIENTFPPYFIDVLKFKLASELSIPIKNDMNYYKIYIEMFNDSLRMARGLDSQRGKVEFIDNSKWLDGLL